MISRNAISKIIKQLPKDFIPVGQYIRGDKNPKDIELITTLTLKKSKTLFNKIFDDIRVITKRGMKKNKLSLVVKHGRKNIMINIWHVKKAELPFMKFWLSYPSKFIARVCAHLKKKGYLLNNKGLFKNNKKVRRVFKDNKDFFIFLRSLKLNYPFRTPAREEKILKGGNWLTDALNNVASFFMGVRQEAPPVYRTNQGKYGHLPIQSIQVCKTPIEGTFDTALNWITLGTWQKQKENLNFDKLFHLYMVLTLSTGQKMILEKNAVVQLYPIDQLHEDAKVNKACIDVPLKGTGPTLFVLMSNAIKRIGEPNIWLYNGENSLELGRPGNCQNFLYNVLVANNLETPANKDFILQDVNKIFKELPTISKGVIQGITDLGAMFDRLLHGGKLKKKKNYKRKIK